MEFVCCCQAFITYQGSKKKYLDHHDVGLLSTFKVFGKGLIDKDKILQFLSVNGITTGNHSLYPGINLLCSAYDFELHSGSQMSIHRNHIECSRTLREKQVRLKNNQKKLFQAKLRKQLQIGNEELPLKPCEEEIEMKKDELVQSNEEELQTLYTKTISSKNKEVGVDSSREATKDKRKGSNQKKRRKGKTKGKMVLEFKLH